MIFFHQNKRSLTLLVLAAMLAGMTAAISRFSAVPDMSSGRPGTQAQQTVSTDSDEEYYDPKTEQRLFELSLGDRRYGEVLAHYKAYPQYLLKALCDDPSLLELMLIYGSGYDPADCYITLEELSQDIPLFIQWDTRWGYASYGDDIIAHSGCGPTCLSMAAVGLTGNSLYTPYYVAKYSTEHGCYQSGVGTSWDLFSQGSRDFGLNCEEIAKDKDVIFSKLAQGYPIICSMMPGDFTDSGHFIVLTGAQKGLITLNDPNSYENSEKLWEYSDLEWQIRNLWCVSKLQQ